MDSKEIISIDSFDSKKYKETFSGSFEDINQRAIITHYLHNIDNNVSEHFKKDAEKTLKNYVLKKRT